MDCTSHRALVFLLASILAVTVSAAAPDAPAPRESCPFMGGMMHGMHGPGSDHRPACKDGAEDCPAMGPGMMGGSRGGQWIHSMKELNISADQRAAMKQIFERNRTRGMELAERGRTIRREFMDTVPDDAAYDAATEQAAAATAAIAADAVKMMAEMRRDVNAILTEDQRRQLRERTDADRKRWEEWRQRHKPAN